MAKSRKQKPDVVQNDVAETVLGMPNFAPGFGAQLSQADTMFKNMRWYLVSNMRQLLSQLYVEYGIIQTIVDVPVDDAFRGGVKIITSQLDEDEIKELETECDKQGDIDALVQAKKWARLFGGGGVVINNGQDPSQPLDIKAMKKGDKLKFVDADMWELFWSQQNTGNMAAVNGADLDVEVFDYYGIRTHESRVIKVKGMKAPSFVRPRLRGWGVSAVEAFIRSLNQYMKATNLSFEILDEFKIDIFKIKGYNNSLISSRGKQIIQDRVALTNMTKNYQSAITMDAEDDYIQKQLSFAGIAETMAGIREQVAADLRMPQTKIFGSSSAGFNSGEDDIENYNAMVESTIRSKSKYEIIKMLELRCAVLFGFVPDDISVEFQPLRVLSSEQEESVKTQKFSRLLQARQAGEISAKDFKVACNKDNLLPVKLKENDETFETEQSKSADLSGSAPAVPKSTRQPKDVKS